MKGLKILQLIDSLNYGGAEILLRDLTRGLAARGHSVSVGYSTPGPLAKDLAELEIPHFHLKRMARIDPLLLIRMMQLIRTTQPDILHTHLFKSDFHGRLAGRWMGVPVVVSTLHNTDSWATHPILGRVYGYTGKFTDLMIAVSDEVREYQIRNTHIGSDRVVTIPNGVDEHRFRPDADAGQRFREKHGISPTTPVIGIVGRLEPQKNQASFLRAAHQIRSEMPRAEFVVVGDGPLKAALQTQAQALGLSSAVNFVGSQRDMPAVYNALNVLVFSSRWEGLPVALLEGLAVGLPVVATRVGGVPTVIQEGASGFLVPVDDDALIAARCLQIFRAPDMAAQFGAAGRVRVVADFSIRKMVMQTLEIYENLGLNPR